MSKKKNYMKKHRYSKGVQLEMNDVDYWDSLDDSKATVKLPSGKMVTEREYMEQFMYENYGNGFYNIDKEDRILQDEQHLKDARRNNNRTNRDALLMALKSGNHIKLVESVDTALTNSYKQMTIDKLSTIVDPNMEKLSHIENWETAYKMDGDQAKALESLTEQTLAEIGLDYSDKRAIVLLRMYFRVKKLIRLIRKDRQNEK